MDAATNPASQGSRTFTLNNGVRMPVLGFGTYTAERRPGETYAAVLKALETGYRHLDCAWSYMNEEEVGTALRDYLASGAAASHDPPVTRADIFVTTKVWNQNHAPDDVAWSARDSCRRLGLNYVDLLLVHWPVACERNPDHTTKYRVIVGPDGANFDQQVHDPVLTADWEPTWRAMEALVDAGIARSIGVSNWTVPGLQRLLGYARIPPAVNQFEFHPFLPNRELVDFCLAHGVRPAAYSPLGGSGAMVREDSGVVAVAERAGLTVPQVVLAWALRRGCAVLPKTFTPARIEANFNIPELSDEDFAAVEKLTAGRHTRLVNLKKLFGYDLWPEEAEAEVAKA